MRNWASLISILYSVQMVSGHLAPSTIRPRQLAPSIFYPLPTEPNTYENYPTCEATSFIWCVQQRWLPGQNILTAFSSIELDGVLFFLSSFLLLFFCGGEVTSAQLLKSLLKLPGGLGISNYCSVSARGTSAKELTRESYWPTWLQIQGENNAIFDTHFG